MRDKRKELVSELVSLIRSSANFEKYSENEILIMLTERVQHDNVLRDDILTSLGLQQAFDELEPDAEVLNSEPKIHYIPPAFDEEADNRRAEEWASITRKYSGQ